MKQRFTNMLFVFEKLLSRSFFLLFHSASSCPPFFFTPSLSILVLVENLLIKIQLSQYQLTSVVGCKAFPVFFCYSFFTNSPYPLTEYRDEENPEYDNLSSFFKIIILIQIVISLFHEKVVNTNSRVAYF